jgi:hypothetical protein
VCDRSIGRGRMETTRACADERAQAVKIDPKKCLDWRKPIKDRPALLRKKAVEAAKRLENAWRIVNAL